MTITISNRIGTDGTDVLEIRGAEITDVNNNPNVSWDDGGAPVYELAIPASEDEAPYKSALASVGLTVVGETPAGDWIAEQTAPLPL